MEIEHLDIILLEFSGLLESWEEICIKISGGEASSQDLDEIFRCAHTIKALVKTLNDKKFVDLIHKCEELLIIMRQDSSILNEETISLLFGIQEYLKKYLFKLKMGGNFAHDLKLEDSFRLQFKAIVGNSSSKRDSDKDGEDAGLSIEEKSGFDKDGFVVFDETSAETPESEKKPTAYRNTADNLSFRVYHEEVVNILSLIEDLSVNLSTLSFHKKFGTIQTKNSSDIIDLSLKTVKKLQKYATNLNMVSLKSLFNQLKRDAYETSKHLRKSVKVHISGEQTRVDKQLIEEVRGAFFHLLRNSIDHGIEPSEDRIALGKSAEGNIHISATLSKSMVYLTFSDDGKGIDIQSIRDRLYSRGIDASSMDDEEAIQYIFKPDLSTKEQISEISGRGIGMNVVKETIDKLNGSITIESQQFKGTSFHVKLPLRSSIIDSMVFEVDGTSLAIPLTNVNQVLILDQFDIIDLNQGNVAITFDHFTIPIHFMREVLCEESNELSILERKNLAKNSIGLLVETAEKSMILAVDRVLNNQEVWVRPIDKGLDRSPFYQGLGIFQNGDPGFIVDSYEILSRF